MFDQFFTPRHIAEHLSAGMSTVRKVADFAIGDGSLISNLPFKPQFVFGIDIDPICVESLKTHNPTWCVMSGDFLDPNPSLKRTLNKLRGQLDAVVLNPPFSCKGKSLVSLAVSRKKRILFRPHLAFIFKSLEYLNETGTLMAILPLSSIKSEIDGVGFNEIKKNWHVSLGETFGPNIFKGCSPNSVVLRFNRKKKCYDSQLKVVRSGRVLINADMFRGSTPMHKTLKNGLYPVLHTTNLIANIEGKYRYSNDDSRLIAGPFLCVPRVCKPDKEKIKIFAVGEFVLSDCIIAIQAKGLEDIKYVQEAILSNWAQFSILYQSTCAPYITLRQLKDFLSEYLINVELTPDHLNKNGKIKSLFSNDEVLKKALN